MSERSLKVSTNYLEGRVSEVTNLNESNCSKQGVENFYHNQFENFFAMVEVET